MERGDAGPEQNVFLQSGPRPTNAWCWRLGIWKPSNQLNQLIFRIFDLKYLKMAMEQSGTALSLSSSKRFQKNRGISNYQSFGFTSKSRVLTDWFWTLRWSNTFINKNLGAPSTFLTQMSKTQWFLCSNFRGNGNLPGISEGKRVSHVDRRNYIHQWNGTSFWQLGWGLISLAVTRQESDGPVCLRACGWCWTSSECSIWA